MATKKCPVCGVAVKLENLERHVRNQHPRADVDHQALLTDEERQESVRAKQTVARPGLTRSGTRLIVIVTVLVSIVLVLVILNPFGNVRPGVGQQAPDFSVRTTAGSTVALSSYRGFVVMLEFMDVDCPACGAEVPTLVALYRNYTSTVRFFSLDVNFVGEAENDEKISAWASSHGATWPYALDSSGSITRTYGVDRTPTTFILDASGIVRAIVQPPGNSYADFV